MASKASGVEDTEPIDVLFALHPKFNLMDFAGPLEVLTYAQHDVQDKCTSHLVASPRALPSLASIPGHDQLTA
jgi:transcriptional regulator GlxA family with amidase domain